MPEASDDARILAVGRRLSEKGGQLAFAETVEVEEGFKVALTLSISLTVEEIGDVAHGRRQTLDRIGEAFDA